MAYDVGFEKLLTYDSVITPHRAVANAILDTPKRAAPNRKLLSARIDGFDEFGGTKWGVPLSPYRQHSIFAVNFRASSASVSGFFVNDTSDGPLYSIRFASRNPRSVPTDIAKFTF